MKNKAVINVLGVLESGVRHVLTRPADRFWQTIDDEAVGEVCDDENQIEAKQIEFASDKLIVVMGDQSLDHSQDLKDFASEFASVKGSLASAKITQEVDRLEMIAFLKAKRASSVEESLEMVKNALETFPSSAFGKAVLSFPAGRDWLKKAQAALTKTSAALNEFDDLKQLWKTASSLDPNAEPLSWTVFEKVERSIVVLNNAKKIRENIVNFEALKEVFSKAVQEVGRLIIYQTWAVFLQLYHCCFSGCHQIAASSFEKRSDVVE